MTDDGETHAWLKGQLGDEQPTSLVGARSPAERRLARKATIHDWVLIGFTVVAVVCGMVVVVAWRHADSRADKLNRRADVANGAVVQALLAGRDANDAVATLANDFAVFVAARSDAERQAALAKLEADRLRTQAAREAANDALARLQLTQATVGSKGRTTASTARASPPTSNRTGTSSTTSTTSTTPTSSTTTTTASVTVPCVTLVQHCP